MPILQVPIIPPSHAHHSSAAAGDTVSVAPSSSSPQGGGSALPNLQQMQTYAEAKFGVSAANFQAAMKQGPVSSAELLNAGVDPATATPTQVAQATMQIQMGKVLGLTPAQATAVMAVGRMGAPAAAVATASVGLVKPIAASGAAQPLTINALPPPQISIKSFFSAISAAMDVVMTVKASMEIADATHDMQMLKDITVQSNQKIEFAAIASAQTVANLRSSIAAMRGMRIMEILVMIIMTYIMIAITVIVSVLTLGVGAPAMIALTIVVVVMLIALLATLMVMNEARKGKISEEDSNDIQYAIMAVEAVATLGVGAAVEGVIEVIEIGIMRVIAKVLQAMVSDAAKEAAESVIKTITKVAAKEAYQNVLKTTTKQMIIKIVGAMVSQAASGMATVMQIRSAGNFSELEAKHDAQSSYASSDQAAAVESTRAGTVAQAQAAQAAGTINIAEMNNQINAANATAAAANGSNLAVLTNSMIVQYASREATLGWITMGVGIASALISGGISIFMSAVIKELSEMLQKALQKLMMILQVMSMALQAGSGIAEAVMQIQMQQNTISNLEAMLGDQQMIIEMDTESDMYQAVQQDIEALMSSAQTSIDNFIAALSAAFDSSSKAMDDIIQSMGH